MENWLEKEISKFEEKYGDIPPPWIHFPETHPYDIIWRMGTGESYIMTFSKWWELKRFNEVEKIAYFKKYPSPPRWLAWKANVIWDLEPWDIEKFDYNPYFVKLQELGFEGTEDYEKDLDDPKWLK